MAFKKEGSVRTRKNGGIELRVRIKGKSKSFYGKDEAEARRKEREYRKQVAVEEKNLSLMTTAEYIQYWLETYKYGSVAGSTYDRLEGAFINHIKYSDVGNKDLTKVTLDDVQKLINKCKSTLSISSLKKIKEVLYPSFQHAVNTGLIEKNPVVGIVLPKNKDAEVETKIVDFYNDEEINKLVLACSPEFYSKNFRRYRYTPMFVFLLNTGLRIGECLALTWDDVDFENRTLNINKTVTVRYERDKNLKKKCKKQFLGTTKTYNSTRVIPLNEAAIQTLLEQKNRNEMLNIESEQHIIFSNYDGGILNIHSVQVTFKRICEDLGINHKGLHALRHTFGSILIRNKVDIKVVSELLGHKDVKFTYNRYIHIIQQQKAEAIKLMNVASFTGGYNVGTN